FMSLHVPSCPFVSFVVKSFGSSPCLRAFVVDVLHIPRRMLQVPQAARIETMKTERCLLVLIFAMVLPGTLLAQAGRRAAPPPKTADKCLLKENINEDIAGQVSKFKLVSMPFSVNGLSEQE